MLFFGSAVLTELLRLLFQDTGIINVKITARHIWCGLSRHFNLTQTSITFAPINQAF
jgi:hypothetical protein